MVPVISEHIEVTLGVCGGRPRIVGHRIRVQDVVLWHERLGMSPDEIVFQHPGITLADVYAALAYYHDHVQEIRQQMAQDELLIEQVAAQEPSRVVSKLADAHATQIGLRGRAEQAASDEPKSIQSP